MLNRVMLIGNLGADPEYRSTTGGANVCSLSLATTDKWKDKEDNMQERTEWHRIVAWGNLAETCNKYLTKGRQIYVDGRLQTRKWQDKEGKDRYTTEIVADSVRFLGPKDDRGASGRPGGRGQSRGSGSTTEEPYDDPVPF